MWAYAFAVLFWNSFRTTSVFTFLTSWSFDAYIFKFTVRSSPRVAGIPVRVTFTFTIFYRSTTRISLALTFSPIWTKCACIWYLTEDSYPIISRRAIAITIGSLSTWISIIFTLFTRRSCHAFCSKFTKVPKEPILAFTFAIVWRTSIWFPKILTHFPFFF